MRRVLLVCTSLCIHHSIVQLKEKWKMSAILLVYMIGSRTKLHDVFWNGISKNDRETTAQRLRTLSIEQNGKVFHTNGYTSEPLSYDGTNMRHLLILTFQFILSLQIPCIFAIISVTRWCNWIGNGLNRFDAHYSIGFEHWYKQPGRNAFDSERPSLCGYFVSIFGN